MIILKRMIRHSWMMKDDTVRGYTSNGGSHVRTCEPAARIVACAQATLVLKSLSA